MRYTQPQSGPLQIDWSNQLEAGVAFVALPHLGIDALTGAVLGRSGTGFVQGVSKNGRGLSSPGSGFLTVNTLPLGQNYTLFAFMAASTGGATQSPIDDDDGSVRAFQFRLASGQASFIPFTAANGNTTISSSAYTAQELLNGVAFSASIDAAGNILLVTAKQVVTGSLGAAPRAPAAQLALLNRKNGTNPTGGPCFLMVGWNRVLSVGEQQANIANPWQLFAAPPRRLWAVPAAGGTNTPINPGAGALAITSYAPSVTQSANRSLSPVAGGLVFTGFAPAIAQPHAVAPGARALVLTGYAPSITQAVNVAITPAAAALAITGYAPSVVRTVGASVLPGVGALSFTGYAPAVVRTQNVAASPGAAQLSVTGYAPTVFQSAPVINLSVRFDRLPKRRIDTVHLSST